MIVTPAFAQAEPAEEPAEALNTQTGAAPNGAEEGVFPPFNPDTFASQLLWLAITFGLFYLFMQKVVVPRIGGVLENRRDRIAQDLDEASRLKDEADEAVAAYEQELAEARSKAQDIANAARDKAKAEADKQRAAVDKELAAKTDEAEAHIAEIKAKALGEVGTIANETAAAIVQQLIDAKATKSEISAAVKAAQSR